MRASLTFPVALAVALLAAAPAASALTLQSNTTSAANGERVADPEDIQQNLENQGTEGNWTTTHIGGATLQFGATRGNDAGYGGNNWFLDSPASRTVPSQAR